MIPKTFEAGNYNTLDTFARQTLPGALSKIRHDLIDKIDEILETMLGANAEILKTEINASISCTGGKISGINCDVLYTIEEFRVPTAPAKAIKTDIQAISDALEVLEDIKIKKVFIDVKVGTLYIEAFVPLEE